MTVSPAFEQQEYVHGKALERNPNGSLVPGAVTPGKFELNDWTSVLSLLIALVGLAGNSMVLWLLAFSIQRNSFSVYLLNLAGADALFLCCSFLISLHEFVNSLFYSFKYEVLIYVTYTFYTVGLSLLAAISTERCLSVLFPLWYRCHRPKRTSAAVCALLWALTSLIGGADCVVCFVVRSHHFCGHFFIIEVTWFSLFTCVLCASSLTLLLRVQCSSQRQQPPRLYLLVLLTVLVFLLCGLPMAIGDFILRFHEVFKPYWLCQLLACVNSSANPFIYFFIGSRSHKRREPLRAVLQRVLGAEQELGAGIKSSPHPSSEKSSLS